jgi:hypothetical protein
MAPIPARDARGGPLRRSRGSPCAERVGMRPGEPPQAADNSTSYFLASGAEAAARPALPQGPRRRQAKKKKVSNANSGNRVAADHAKYAKKDGIRTPRDSAMARTMKFGALPT